MFPGRARKARKRPSWPRLRCLLFFQRLKMVLGISTMCSRQRLPAALVTRRYADKNPMDATFESTTHFVKILVLFLSSSVFMLSSKHTNILHKLVKKTPLFQLLRLIDFLFICLFVLVPVCSCVCLCVPLLLSFFVCFCVKCVHRCLRASCL